MIYPRLKARLSTPWYGNYNGVWTQFDLPVNTEFEVVDIIDDPSGRNYICKVTLNGRQYTDMKINEVFVNPPGNVFILMPPGQAGGKKRKSRLSRKMGPSHRSRRFVAHSAKQNSRRNTRRA